MLALVAGAIMLAATGFNPLAAYQALGAGAFGTQFNAGSTFVKATPLMLIGVGLAVAFKCKVWNIGAEGQLLMGATFGSWFALTFGWMHAAALIPLIIIFGFAGGAFWALIPAVLKTRLGVNEIITTLMMNFIAFYLLDFLVYGPLRDPSPLSGEFPYSAPMPDSARFFIIVPGTTVHLGLIIALLFAVAIFFLMSRTTLGYQIRATGTNPKAARYGGISVNRTIIMAMLISGGLSGVAGMSEVAGVTVRLFTAITVNYGYLAIAVALLGKLHPLGIVLSSILFAALVNGGDTMQRALGVPIVLVLVFEGLVVLLALSSDFLTRRRR
ncbi:MAG: ABC transporter permease [Candidatus Bathyarchaeia archaeon]